MNSEKFLRTPFLIERLWWRRARIYEYAESFDVADFTAKLISLKEKWEALILGFYCWFETKIKPFFIKAMLQSAQDKADIQGLYYQNDIERQRAVKKCIIKKRTYKLLKKS